ncbi:hypothetical protein ABD77_03560 [Brevibacillus formosus]|nr:hypothetical protein [Brevibacillus formosus]
MKVIRENFDDVLRLAHSIREGKVSGALIMAKLGSYARQNKVAKALREMGRIERRSSERPGKNYFLWEA